MSPLVFVLNGPNLNTLGKREPGIYGSTTLAEIERNCRRAAEAAGLRLEFRQTNHEGVLVDWIHEAEERADAIVINAGAYTHTSIAIHDALRFFGKTVIELHLSNIHARETFRHRSLIAPVATAIIAGLGPAGYELAISALGTRLAQT